MGRVWHGLGVAVLQRRVLAACKLLSLLLICRSGVWLLLTHSVYFLFAVKSLTHDGFDSLGYLHLVT